jgi:hypothetical protein
MQVDLAALRRRAIGHLPAPRQVGGRFCRRSHEPPGAAFAADRQRCETSAARQIGLAGDAIITAAAQGHPRPIGGKGKDQRVAIKTRLLDTHPLGRVEQHSGDIGARLLDLQPERQRAARHGDADPPGA